MFPFVFALFLLLMSFKSLNNTFHDPWSDTYDKTIWNFIRSKPQYFSPRLNFCLLVGSKISKDAKASWLKFWVLFFESIWMFDDWQKLAFCVFVPFPRPPVFFFPSPALYFPRLSSPFFPTIETRQIHHSNYHRNKTQKNFTPVVTKVLLFINHLLT